MLPEEAQLASNLKQVVTADESVKLTAIALRTRSEAIAAYE